MMKLHLSISSFDGGAEVTMRKKVSIILSGFLFLAITLFVFHTVFRVVERKGCINTYLPFFEEENEFDVLFFGSSHVACDVSPMDLWNDYGITSYNFGNSGEPIPVTYWTMRMATEYKTPKLVVVDAFGFGNNVRYTDDATNSTHNSWDCFPLTRTKVAAINDLIEDRNTRFEYMFDIGKYHDRWPGLTVGDFVPAPSRDKGIWAYGPAAGQDRLLASLPQKQNKIIYDSAKMDESFAGIEYMRKTIEYCQQQGMEVLLTFNPYICSEKEQMQGNALQQLADEYGVGYINFVQMNRVVDYSVDMMDIGHTNPSGMKKVTDYLGDYIVSHYAMENHREDPAYASWHEDYEDFLNYKIETIVARGNLMTVLELLHDKSFSCVVSVKPGTKVLDVPYMQNALQNITRDHIYQNTDTSVTSAGLTPLTKLSEAAERKLGYKLSVDHIRGTVSEEAGRKINSAETSDVHILVIDNRNGQIISDMRWNYVLSQGFSKVAEAEGTL